MDDHIEELFQKVFAADDGSWCKDPEYEKALTEAFDLEHLMKLLHGPTAHKLLTRFLDAYRIVECFHYHYYFRQGYLAAREGFGVPDMEDSQNGDAFVQKG